MSRRSQSEQTTAFSTINEKHLHAQLKAWYARPDDRVEVPVDGYVIDIVRSDLLIEIQTTSFASIKGKLDQLSAHHPVRLVYPIARERWIVKQHKDGTKTQKRRKSPKRGSWEEVFVELVSFPHLLARPSFSLELLLIQEEQIRRFDGRRAWRRRGWTIHERRLLKVVDHKLFRTPQDVGALLPANLENPFTTAELARALRKPRWLAQKMAYCLREMGTITPVGKRRNAILYTSSSGKN
jgi:hypothetical protein